MSKYKDVLVHFSEAPSHIIDQKLAIKLKDLSEQKEVLSDEILAILDMGARYSMMSPIGMASLNAVWEVMISNEGKTIEQAQEEAKPRREKMILEEADSFSKNIKDQVNSIDVLDPELLDLTRSELFDLARTAVASKDIIEEDIDKWAEHIAYGKSKQ